MHCSFSGVLHWPALLARGKPTSIALQGSVSRDDPADSSRRVLLDSLLCGSARTAGVPCLLGLLLFSVVIVMRVAFFVSTVT